MKARSFAAVVLGLALGAAARQPPSASLDFSGCFPTGRIRTVALVMPASIQPKRNFDRGKAALEAAGYKVKVMPRLDFKTVAPVADRVAVMAAGRIVELGPAAKIFSAPEHPVTKALLAAEPR